MTVLSGEVRTTINMRGVGDASSKVNETTRAIKGAEDAAKGAGASFISMRERITQVAGVADSALGKVTGQVGAVIAVTDDATKNFGVLGTVVAGVVAISVGLVSAFDAIEKARFESTTKSLQGAADAAGELARGLANAASNARDLNTSMKAAEIRTLTAQIATAMASGDVVGAGVLRAKLAAVSTGNESSALRTQGAMAVGESIDATTKRTLAIASLTQLDAQIAQLQTDIGDPNITAKSSQAAFLAGNPDNVLTPEQRRLARLPGRDVMLAQLAGLQGLRPGLVGSIGMVPADTAANDLMAARTMFGAADAVDKQGQAEGVRAVIDGAVAVLTNYVKNNKTGGAAPDPFGVGKADKNNAALRAALLSGDQATIDAAFARDSQKGMAANDNQLVGALTQIDAQAKAGEAIANYSDALERAALGTKINEFTGALTSSLPAMDEFKNSLGEMFGAGADLAAENVQRLIDAVGQVGALWEKWGKGALTTKQAVIGSLGAMAVAGAQSIKDERLRAGVLSIIFAGLGTAHVLTPGMEVQGAGELAAAGILGAVAIFGSSKGGSKAAGARGAGDIRPVNDNSGGAPIVLNINAPWFGPSPQEAAAGLAAFLGRVDGTGFGAAA